VFFSSLEQKLVTGIAGILFQIACLGDPSLLGNEFESGPAGEFFYELRVSIALSASAGRDRNARRRSASSISAVL